MRVQGTPQFWWRVVVVLAAAAGLLGGDHRIAYFTTQSNIVVLGYFGGVLYWMVRRGTTEPAAPRLRGPVTLAILITGLVSHVLLSNGANPLPGLADPDPAEALSNWSAFLVHYVVPVMVVLDWLLFGPHAVSKWRDLPLWIVYPLGYGVVMEVRAILFPDVPSRYPYFFLDPTGHGYGWVAGQFLQLGLMFTALGALLMAGDRLSARLRRRSATPGVTRSEAEDVQV